MCIRDRSNILNMTFNIDISQDNKELGQKSGDWAAAIIKKAIAEKGQANIILATGTSQFETLQQLLTHTDIDWGNVVMFHLDEYIGLPITAPDVYKRQHRRCSRRFLALTCWFAF